MGRSKFPGKPSKHTNRKRVNVLPPTGETINVDICNSVTVGSVIENKQDEELPENNSESNVNDNVLNTKVSIKRRLTRKMQTSLRNKSATKKRNLLSKICAKTNLKTKLNSKGPRNTKLAHRSTAQKEANNLVGKFVLPTRSVHSSRVIKPNKRFINVDLNETITLKKKVISKKHCVKKDEEKISENNGSFNNEGEKTPPSNGRVVLRQARLKLHTQTPSGPEGPFSSNINNGSPPGTVTCGVCGAVRFYRFVKQARKFNIYSCESCRKFISKMIKRQTCGKAATPLVCLKGQGMCHVPPIVRSQQWKLIRCAYKARCPACWLKMCLRSFQMPMSLKHSLSQMLPQNMKGPDIIFNNTLPLLWQNSVEHTDCKTETMTTKQRPVRFKNPKVQIVHTPTPPNSDIKRQKIDLKGPRVKHVCRSASIVLGQPLATFGTDSEKKNDTQDSQQTNEIKPVDEPKPVSSEKSVESKPLPVNSVKTDSNSSYSETESSDSDKISRLILNETVPNHRRERTSKSSASTSNNSNESKSNSDRKSHTETQNGISIDFWEGYDPDEICQNGYCLIATEQFPMPSICFLCGSGGKEMLRYCAMCCETYHSFCLEQRSPTLNNNNEQNIWLCPRCTVCAECNQNDRQKVHCQKCSKAYHSECFNKKWNSNDRPTVCSKCLKCKSCGSENITKFVGNLPLCINCFKLRKKGNFCPICQHCYDENECCSKMMECAKCNKWVHAKCEELSEEQYQILSILPETIEYFCGLCSTKPKQYWRKAIDSELKSSFNQVIRMLSKNKTARDTLKWSPLNNHTPSCKSITNVRKLQFSDVDADLDNNNYSKSIADINKIYSFEENELLLKAESETVLLKSATNQLSMVDIKNKLNSNDYCSVRDFNKDMEEALNNTHSEQLQKIYHSIFRSVFPWYESKKTEDNPVKAETISTDETISSSEESNQFTQVEFDLTDSRMCLFCKGTGDGLSHEESRLLYCGVNEWVHANCALWSSEVYEEIDGSLQNVQSALSRGRLIRCAKCKQKGASVGCCYKGCYETYHFICARTAKCNFMHDKTVYCAIHEVPNSSHILTNPKEFDLFRSIFVELDRKKKKYSDIEKINFMVGSLCVTNLGKINPLVSDTPDVIIPMGFICTRLYWSTVEPWKLVQYNITISMVNSHSGTMLIDRNFTVDHNLPKPTIEKMMKDLTNWQKDLDRKKSDIVEYEDDEEPQNGADFLSPELTNAILEELPNDLLDGISVQDIFPSASLIFSMDFKSDLNNSENFNDQYKKPEIDEDNVDIDAKNSRELRRCKSEIIPSLSKSRGQQRSCSLTLSCKLDSSLSPAIKKRKIAATRENNMFFQLLQVDGNCDSDSSECGSPNGPEIDPWGNPVSEQPVTCEKCQCTYRTQASYKRHLDSCEVLTSESDSEHDTSIAFINNKSSIVENSTIMDEPSVVLTSFESYQNEIHTSVLNTQTFVTSKSTSELISVPQSSDIAIQNIQQPVHQKQLMQPTFQTLPVNSVAPMTINSQVTDTSHSNQTQYTINPTITISDNISQPTQYCVNQTVPLCVNQPIHLQSNGIQVSPSTPIINTGNQLLNQTISINQGSIQINQPSTIQQPLEFQPQSVTIQSVPFNNNVTPILNVTPQNQFTLNGKIITNPLMQTVNVPTTQWIKPVNKPAVITQKTIKSRSRSRTIAAKRPHYEDGETIILPQNSNGAQVIVQHLPSTNFVPTLVDPFQQQSAQNLQYVATITPQVNTTLPTQSLVQLQPDNNLISIVPGLQPTMIIQQPRVIENQLVLDSNGSLGWAPQTVQPVYYGFETIVQNTVMQSQQFLPTTMPGVLTANSSYSTTTQVFQTSKLEPVLDVSSNSFVLVNPSQLVNSQAIEVPQYSQTQPVNTVVSNIVPQQDIKPSQPQIIKYSQPITSHKPATVTTSASNHNITNTFVHEQNGITNVTVTKPTQNRPITKIVHNGFKENKKLVIEEPKKKILEELKKSVNHIKAEDPKKHIQLRLDEYKRIVQMKFEEPKKFTIVKLEEPKKPLQSVQSVPIKKEEPKKLLQIKVEEPKKPVPVIKFEDVKKPVALMKMPLNEEPSKVPAKFVPTNVVSLKSEQPHIVPSKAIPSTAIPAKLLKVNDITIEEANIEVKSAPAIKHLKKELEPIEKSITPFPAEKENTLDDRNETSLKLVFQKQGQDGTYKISNSKPPIQITPLKTLKNNNNKSTILPLTDKMNKSEEITNKATTNNNNNNNNNSKRDENSSSILYTIETKDGFKYSSTSVSDLWDKVFEAVQNARIAHNMPPLPSGNIMGNIQVFGLKSTGLKYLIEQLPGATKCTKYKPAFNFPAHLSELDDDFLTGHTFGAIRCSSVDSKPKEPYDMFGWLSSKHRRPEEVSFDSPELPRRGSINNLPMAMRFRQLKLTSKFSVGVYRSNIHGRGLFCLRDIESGEMVIEYAGEVIRSVLTDKREKYYNSKGIGCYMFRVDDNFVVDATMKGNAARFINHSCDPNCYSRVVEILGHKHIIIFALRRILSGEELTYDYKFPFEEDKIPCTCGSRKCRKFLN